MQVTLLFTNSYVLSSFFYVKLVPVGSSVFHPKWWAKILRAGRARPVPTTVVITLFTVTFSLTISSI